MNNVHETCLDGIFISVVQDNSLDEQKGNKIEIIGNDGKQSFLLIGRPDDYKFESDERMKIQKMR
ncbi:hypothetical protein BLOT_010025 [Blomia tropicalis]|nr:hypothetical protein BLOT_010025 [Blomia tropicalis]